MAAPPLQPATPDSTSIPAQQQADQAAGVVHRVVCYLRTANAGSAGQRLLDRQRAKLDHHVAAHGWTVAAWVEDLHQSGATLHRPGLREALALLADHQADALLAVDHARLAITPHAAGQLAALADRRGWRVLTLHTISSTPAPACPPRPA
jgi:DNA invertase Pin-like site-specific DNA recombinase